MTDRVHCSACAGTGRAPLDRELQRTLDVCRELAERGERITAHAVCQALAADPFPAKHTAVCNRLVALARFGLLRRLGRDGRRVIYEVAPPFETRETREAAT